MADRAPGAPRDRFASAIRSSVSSHETPVAARASPVRTRKPLRSTLPGRVRHRSTGGERAADSRAGWPLCSRCRKPVEQGADELVLEQHVVGARLSVPVERRRFVARERDQAEAGWWRRSLRMRRRRRGGMWRSRTAASGWSSSTSSIAASPFVAVDHGDSRWCSMRARRCSRNASSSSASRTRISPSEVSALKVIASHRVKRGLGQGRTIAPHARHPLRHPREPAGARPGVARAGALDVDRWLLGGDYGTPSPWPEETIARLKELPSATWIRGNGERWLREPRGSARGHGGVRLFKGSYDEELVDWLCGLPARAELDGALYVHGSPLPTTTALRPSRRRARGGCSSECTPNGVFGHSHQQFRRPGRTRPIS